MKTKDKPNNNKDKDKKIILWEVKSFPAIEIYSSFPQGICIGIELQGVSISWLVSTYFSTQYQSFVEMLIRFLEIS